MPRKQREDEALIARLLGACSADGHAIDVGEHVRGVAREVVRVRRAAAVHELQQRLDLDAALLEAARVVA